MPKSLVPALLLITVRPFAPWSRRAAIRFSGIPHRPKPETMIDGAVRDVAHGLRGVLHDLVHESPPRDKIIPRQVGTAIDVFTSDALADIIRCMRTTLDIGKRAPAPDFRWTSRPMRSLVDPADKDAVYAILDRPDRAAEP